jgi:hypothetical protein
MAAYYRKIKGKNYDKRMIDTAARAIKGKGDGRISLQDAKKLLGSVKDASGYTDVEKRTMKYIRDKFVFTPEANKWFRTEVSKWAAFKGAAKKAKKKK